MLLLLAAVIFPLEVRAASPESRELIRQGIADLEERKPEDALKKFEAASQADPTDAEAVFYQGFTLNLLGRPLDALERLSRAGAMGYEEPGLAFQTGWAFLGAGLWKEAAAELERSERLRPGRGKTSEFLGRAYLALGELDKAEARLKEALERDPTLKPTVLFYLAAVEREHGRMTAAGQRLEELLREAPESPLGRVLREQLERLARVAPPIKPWRVTISASGGFNSNVIALGDEVSRPSDITSKGSGFSRFTLGAAYDWRLTPDDTLTAAYGFLADVYEALPDFDLRDHLGVLDLRHAFTRDLAGALRVSNEFTEVGGEAFRNQFLLRPALGYWLTDWLGTELAYSWALSEYYFPSPPVQDRDGTGHTVALTGFFAPPGTRLQGRLGYYHVWNAAEGADFDFDTDAFFIGLGHPLPWDLRVEVFWTRMFDRYDNPNSLAGATGFEFRRKDDVDIVTAQLVRPLFERIEVYGRYDFVTTDSNIRFFEFHQHVWSFGLIASF